MVCYAKSHILILTHTQGKAVIEQALTPFGGDTCLKCIMSRQGRGPHTHSCLHLDWNAVPELQVRGRAKNKLALLSLSLSVTHTHTVHFAFDSAHTCPLINRKNKKIWGC